jgi:hypothetical protein
MLTSTYILLFLDTRKVVEVGYGAELVGGDIPLWKRCRVVVVALTKAGFWSLILRKNYDGRRIKLGGRRALKHVIDVKTVSRPFF